MNIELADPVHAFKLLETVERHFACPCNKLQEFGTLLLVKRADSTPEPLDLRWRGRIIMVLGIGFPVVHVNLGETGDKKFKLLFVEDGN